VRQVTQRQRQRLARQTKSGRPATLRVPRRLQRTGGMPTRPNRALTISTLSVAAFLALPLSPALAANAPVVLSSPASPGNSLNPSWSFSADAGASTDCRTMEGTTVVSDWAACDQATGYSVDLTGWPDDTYTAEIRATDGSGSATTTSDYVLDTLPPVAPSLTSTPSTPSTDHNPSWSWTSAEGSDECKLTSGPTTVSDWAPCTSPQTYALVGDGGYTFSVRSVDTAGNTGPAATDDYTLDTQPPAAPAVVTASATPGSSTTAKFTFTGEAGTSAHCRLLKDGTPVTAYAGCPSPDFVDLTPYVDDATYTLEVYLVDSAGNVGSTGTADYVLDRLAPNAPTIDTDPGSTDNDTTPTWTFSDEPGAQFECRVDGPVSAGTYAACTSPYSPTLGQGDGSYTFRVRAIDAAGNTGSAATSTYLLDTTAPAAPVVTAPPSPSQDTTPTFTFTAESGATTECRLDGPAGNGTWTSCTSPRTPTLSDGDGTYILRVRATDAVGNVSTAGSASYVLDQQAPGAPVVSGPTGPAATTSVTWTFTAEAGATTECRLTGPGGVGGWTSCTSPVTRTLGQGDGSYTLEVRATDTAGNVGAIGSASYVLDTTGPASPVVTPPTTPGTDTTPTFTFTAEAGSTTECRIVGPTTTTAWVACTSPRTITANQGDGTYTLQVRATDSSGNLGTVGAGSYVLDTTAPAAPTVNGPTSPGNSTAVSFSFTAEAGASTQCRLAGPGSPGSFAACTSPYAATLANGDGAYTFSVRAIDAAGNSGPTQAVNYVLDTAAPSTPTVNAPSSPGNDTTPTFTFNTPAGTVSLECRLDGPTATGTWAPCSSPSTVTLSQGEGTYTFLVRATDAAGNTSGAGSASYVLDTTPPAAPVVSGPSGPGAATSVSFTFTTEAGATTECRVVGPTTTTAWSACTSPRTLNANQGDGTYTVQVRATDAAGNLGSAGSKSYILDTTAPAAPSVSGPASPGNSSSVTFTFTTEAGASASCRLDVPTGLGTWAPCSSPYAATLSYGDGTYTFSVRATDAAGNTGLTGSASYVLDTAPPNPPVITPPASPGNDTTPTFTFTTPPGAVTLVCRLDGPGGPGTWAACTSPSTVTLSQGDGAYTFLVRATDAAGNTSSPGSASYLLDTVAPAAPVVSGPSGPSNATSVSWTFTAEAGSTTQCRLLFGASPVSAWSNCTSPKTYALASGDGSYSVQVQATDAAGNTGPVGTSGAYLLDTTAPTAPALSGPVTPGNVTAVTFTFTAEAGSSTECRLDTPLGAGAWVSCTSPAARTLSQGDGLYVFRVRATDPAGNTSPVSSFSYTLDTVPPAAPVVTPPTSPGNVTSVNFTFTAEAGSSKECRLTGPGGVGAWTPCTSPTAINASQGDGTYTLEVRATDPAGNTGAVGSASYVLDTAAPAAPVVSGPSGPSNATSVSWTFTAEAGSMTQCRVFLAGSPVTAWHACTSPDTETLGSGDGSYTVQVRATDAAGNLGPAGSSGVYLLDTTAPTAPTLSGPATPGNKASVTFTFSAEAGASLECRLDGPAGVGAWGACTSPQSLTLSQGDGLYVFRVRATDAAGNTSAVTSVSYRLDTGAPAAPVVTAPTSPSNNTLVNFTFTAEAGSTTECRLTGPGGVGAWTSCTSPDPVNANQGDGTYVLDVRATDAAGNVGATGSASYLLDTAAPAAPVVSGPSGPSNATSVSWTFTAEAGSTTECRLFFSGVAVTGWHACTSPDTETLGSGDGNYTLRVRATDPAGNLGPVGSSGVYVLDTTAPSAPSLSGPATPGKNTTVTYTFSAEAGATLECRLDGPGGVGPWVACTSPRTVTLSQGDGFYVFRVRATDVAGNTGPASSVGYTLDTVAPLAPTITSSPTSPGKSRSPSWSFTLPEGTAVCQISFGATVVVPFTACTSPYVADLTGQPDGLYTFSVSAVDTAGNVGPAATSTYLLDTTPPVPTGITPATGTNSNDTTPTWTFTVEPGATTQCAVMRGGTIIVPFAVCTGPYSVDLSSTGDGSYSFLVKATDIAGNAGAPVTTTYLLDTVAPTAPVITSAPPSVASNRSPSWGFTAEAGATLQCRIYRDGTTPGGWSTCTSPYVANLATASDGTYDFEVRAIDTAGNIGPSTTRVYTLDTTAPAPPTLVSSPGTPSPVHTPAWGFSAETGATTECQIVGPGGVVAPWATCSSPYVADLTAQPDGDYTFQVRATDAAGNVGPALSVPYTLDSTAPSPPTITSAPPGPASDRTPTWTFTGEPGATLTCTITRGTTVVIAATTCTSPFTADLTGQPDGVYTLTVTATDTSGNTSAASSATYILDTTAPKAPRFTRTPTTPDSIRTPSWSWAKVTGTTASCRLTRDGVVIVNWRTCGSPFIANLSGRPDGTYTLSVRLTDTAGNVGPAATSNYVLDTTAPGAPGFTSKPSSPDSDRRPSWSWTLPSGTRAECLVTRGGGVVRDWSACGTTYLLSLTGQPDGTYRLAVRLIDVAGNVGPYASSSYTLDSTRTPPAGGGTGGDTSGGGPSNDGGGGGGVSGNSGIPPVTPITPQVPTPDLSTPIGALPRGSAGHPALKATGKTPEQTSSRPLFSPQLPPVGDVPTVIGKVAVKSLEKPQFPLLLLVVVALFLLIQNRIDRKDPKLASAPVESEPMLSFGPIVEAP
jgi:hypothetical protein